MKLGAFGEDRYRVLSGIPESARNNLVLGDDDLDPLSRIQLLTIIISCS